MSKKSSISNNSVKHKYTVSMLKNSSISDNLVRHQTIQLV